VHINFKNLYKNYLSVYNYLSIKFDTVRLDKNDDITLLSKIYFSIFFLSSMHFLLEHINK